MIRKSVRWFDGFEYWSKGFIKSNIDIRKNYKLHFCFDWKISRKPIKLHRFWNLVCSSWKVLAVSLVLATLLSWNCPFSWMLLQYRLRANCPCDLKVYGLSIWYRLEVWRCQNPCNLMGFLLIFPIWEGRSQATKSWWLDV